MSPSFSPKNNNPDSSIKTKNEETGTTPEEFSEQDSQMPIRSTSLDEEELIGLSLPGVITCINSRSVTKIVQVIPFPDLADEPKPSIMGRVKNWAEGVLTNIQEKF